GQACSHSKQGSGASDVLQDGVDVLISGQVVEDPEAEVDRPADGDGREPGEPASFDLLLDSDLDPVEPRESFPRQTLLRGKPSGPRRQVPETETGALHGRL